MRPVTVTLYVNDGTLDLASSQSVESRLVELGSLAWEIDEQLTKIQASDLTLQIADEGETVWTWLQTQIQTLQEGASQLFPPWLVVDIGGENRFTGLVDLTSISRSYGSRIIDLSAQDWSQMLANITLEDVERDLPRAPGLRGAADIGVGSWPGPGWWQSYVTLPEGADLVKGDYVTSDITGIQQYKVISIRKFRNRRFARLGGSHWWSWKSLGAYSARFTRVASDVDTLLGFIAQSGVLTGNAVRLDTVDGLIPGDTLRTTSGTEILVSDIDAERKEIISGREISGVKAGTKLYLSAESAKYLATQDAPSLAARLAMPYEVDTTRFVPSPLVDPLFAWLTTDNVAGKDLLNPSDIEPTTSGVRILCQNGAWAGTPETGFVAAGDWGLRNVDWTDQLTAAPAFLMPDEGPAIAPPARQRNRTAMSWAWNQASYIDSYSSSGISYWAVNSQPTYTPRTSESGALLGHPAKCIGYDYSQMRRVVVTNPDSGQATYSEQRWTGSAWTAAATGNWPVLGWFPCQLVPMIGTISTSGPTPLGLAWLGLVTNGSAYALHLIWAGSLVTLDLDATIVQGASLATTPWGVYLLGPGGYGRITYSGEGLDFSWCAIGDAISSVLLVPTFAPLDASAVHCLLRIDTPDPENQTKLITETRLLKLTTTPIPETDPVLSSQKVMAGAPKIARCFRDPSTSGRLIGLLGSRLFRVSNDPPRVIERIAVSTMTGQEALEHIGQYLNAVVIPREAGRVELVSRAQPGAPTAITVDRVEMTQTRISKHFFSVVRVSSEDDELYSDAYGSVVGGKALEIESAPTVWTEAGCQAMATNLASFFGTPRRMEEQVWVHEDPDTAAPWESIAPWSPITINGGSTVWLLAGCDYDWAKGEATVTLLERV